MMATLLIAAVVETAVDGVISAAGYTPLVSEWSVPIGILAATWVMLKWVDGKSWEYVGLDMGAAKPRKLLEGSALGLLPIAVPSLVLLAAGQLSAIPSQPGSWWNAAAVSLANLFPAALGEELLLRGYI